MIAPIQQQRVAAETRRSHAAARWQAATADRVRRSTAPKHVAGAPLLRVVEALLPTLVLLVVVVAANLGTMPAGIDSFLQIRVTVKNVLLGIGLTAGCVAILNACGVYDARAVRKRRGEISRVLLAWTLCTALAVVFPLTSISGGVRFRDLFSVWAGLVGAGLLLRAARRLLARRTRASAPRRVIVAGPGRRALQVWSDLTADDSTAHELVGFVDVDGEDDRYQEVEHRRLGTIDDLEGLLMKQNIDEVFIALPIDTRYREFQHVIRVCERVGVRTKYRADMFTTLVAWPRAERGGHSVVTMHVAPDDYRLMVKRVFDIVGALTLLTILSPLMLLIALAVKATSAGPVLFAQDRSGLNKRSFRMLKFRSMVADADALQATLESRNEKAGPIFKITDDPRVTWVGRLLRRTSMDELPQLFNVLKGEMSLVGPRPMSFRDVRRFRRAGDMRRFSVKPGLTCLWQISGRSELGFDEWVQLDLKYIDGWSLAQDLRILLWTIPAVVRGTGAV